MLIEVRRYKRDENGTLGILFIDGEFECFTLEDPPKEYVQPDPTRIHYRPSKGSIPTGTYPMDMRTVGGMHHRYKRKFDEHRGMLWLRGVPDFHFVYIHIGNYVDDTEGCILVGAGVHSMVGKSFIQHSKLAYRRFYGIVACAVEATNDVRIKITEV